MAARARLSMSRRLRSLDRERIADGDTPSAAHMQVETKIGVPVRLNQRARNVEIARAGGGIDVGGGATGVAPVDIDARAADRQRCPDPLMLGPGLGAVEIKVGAEAPEIEPIAPLRFDRAYR